MVSDLNPHDCPTTRSPPKKSQRVSSGGDVGNSGQTANDSTGNSGYGTSLDFSMYLLKSPHRPTVNR